MPQTRWLAGALATLVLNEVLYDPPGPDAGREFVEIFNAADAGVPLAGVDLEVGDGARPGVWRSIWRGTEGELAPGALLVVGGDSIEAARFHLGSELQNGPDAVRLRRGDAVLDRLGYGALTAAEMYESRPAADVAGMSLARVPDGHDSDDNAADFGPAAPTPGRRNQPLHAWRLTVAAPDPTRAWPGRRLHVLARVHNQGREPLPAGDWELGATLCRVEGEPYREVPSLGAPWPLEVQGGPAGALAHGDSATYDIGWTADSGLFQFEIEAHGADEDTTDNRARTYLRVGAGPVLVNEIQYAPEGGEPEWIEIWNRDTRAHDVDGWTIAGAATRPARLHARGAVAAGGFAVASADTLQAIRGLEPGCRRVAATPWPSLNNTDGPDGYADRLILRDPAGVVHDAMNYAAAWGAGRGRSLERLTPDPDVRGLVWAPCKVAMGSTPGRTNSATAPPRPHVGVLLEPNPFSPDGDGHEDLLGVRLEMPTGYVGFRASVFDLAGRQRRILAADRLGPGPRTFFWDGKDSAAVALPRGAYVLQIEFYAERGRRWRELRTIGLVRP